MIIIYPSTTKNEQDVDVSILAVLTPSTEFLATLTGTDEEKLIYVANKDLPVGTKYEITDADLSDRSFRNAWEYVAGASERTSEENP